MLKTVEQTVATLKVLQAVDDELARLREKLAALSLRVDEQKKRVSELDAAFQRKAVELKTGEKDSAMRELDLKVIQDKINRLKLQLSSLKTNKQYAAIMSEIGGHEAEGSRTEDAVLSIMDRIEGTRSQMDAVRAQMDEARRGVSEVEAGVADEVRDLSGRIRELTAERQGLVQQLDRTVAADYDRIGRSRNGKVVVAVKDGTCQGCFMGVTRQMIARLWSKKELLHCPNCARLMYLEGEVE